MENFEVAKFFNAANDTDKFVPLEYSAMHKALDLGVFLRQLQQMINTPLPPLPEEPDPLKSLPSLLPPPLATGSHDSPISASRKRLVSQLFNFDTVAKRKWLKNLLLEFDCLDERMRVNNENLDIILKIHKYRRSLQRDCLAEILNSQYLYYSSGLMSEYDRYPEHRKFILDQYGYSIPIQQASSCFKLSAGRKRKPSAKAVGAALRSGICRGSGGSLAGGQAALSMAPESLLSCPCSPNTCRCASLKFSYGTTVEPNVFHLWNMMSVHEFPKAYQQWRVATIYRQSVLKNLAISSVAYVNRPSDRPGGERGRQAGSRSSRKAVRPK